MEIHDLSYYAVQFGYIGIFIYFISLDQLTPIPNEISLFTIGLLCAKGVFNVYTAGIVSLAAFITIDLIYFFVFRTGNKWLKNLNHKMERPFIKRMADHLNSDFPKWIIILCFVPRMRFWSPIISSFIGVSGKRFIKYDALGLLLFTTIYLSSGVLIHKGWVSFLNDPVLVQNIIFIGVTVVAAILLIYTVRRIYKRHKERLE